MFHPVARWLCLIAFLAGQGSVSAHSGYENETEVRLFVDRMDINVRTTFGFAWKILGHRAPSDIGEASQRIAGPLLAAEAADLFDVASAGMEMDPRSADCKFELDEHVVFLLTFDRPPDWPLVLNAKFFDFFDPLTYGTVRVFDQTADPYLRDIEPVAEGKIYRTKPVFTFDPGPHAEVAVEVPVAVPASPPEKPNPLGYRGIALMALLLVLIWWNRRVSVRGRST